MTEQTILIAIYFIFFFATAIEWGRFEKFIFGDCQLHVGAPDLLGYFKSDYHVPMASIVLAIAMFMDFTFYEITHSFFGFVFFTPSWFFIEDIATWIGNPFDRLDAKDWVSAGLSGRILFGQFIPNTYFLFLLYTMLAIFVKVYVG